MKTVAKFVVHLLAIGMLFAPLAGQAADGYAMTGKLLAKHSKYINVGDVQLLLSPTVKVVKPGKKNASMSDIKPGDNVGVKMLEFRGKAYVDTVFYLTGSGTPANE